MPDLLWPHRAIGVFETLFVVEGGLRAHMWADRDGLAWTKRPSPTERCRWCGEAFLTGSVPGAPALGTVPVMIAGSMVTTSRATLRGAWRGR